MLSQAELRTGAQMGRGQQLPDPHLCAIGEILSLRVRKEQPLKSLKGHPTLGGTRVNPSSF